MEKFNKELIAASTIPIILGILENEDNYGYQIIKEVQSLSDGELSWKEGSLYPVLTKLEQRGLIRSYIVETEGRKRKYYSINKKGNHFLKSIHQEWMIINQTLNKLWTPKPDLI